MTDIHLGPSVRFECDTCGYVLTLPEAGMAIWLKPGQEPQHMVRHPHGPYGVWGSTAQHEPPRVVCGTFRPVRGGALTPPTGSE